MAHLIVQTTDTLTRWLVHGAPADLERERAVEEVSLMLTRYVEA